MYEPLYYEVEFWDGRRTYVTRNAMRKLPLSLIVNIKIIVDWETGELLSH